MSVSLSTVSKTLVTTLLATGLFCGSVSATSPKTETVSTDKIQKVVKEKQKIHVNINTANQAQLMAALKGVGNKKAQAIIDYRKANGQFKSVESLLAVKGIGEKILEKNKNRIMLSGKTSAKVDKKVEKKASKKLDKLKKKEKSALKI